jgi:hypothetical protein
MTSSERRAALIQLLAENDQQIAKPESLATDRSLDADGREYAGGSIGLPAAGGRAG